MPSAEPTPVTTSTPPPKMTAVSDVTTQLSAWLRRLPPQQDRIERLIAELDERFRGRTEPISSSACAEIEQVAWPYSRHLLLDYDPAGTDPPDEEDPGWPEPDPETVRHCGAQVTQVSRLEGGACLIRIDGLEALRFAQPYIDGAFALARGATGILLDLRVNGGGYPETVAYIAGLLLGEKAEKLSEVTYRDHQRHWWSPDLSAGTAVPGSVPVAVLVSRRTFSSGEALAYHLQARGRVVVVGERTPGAADHISSIRLAPTVECEVPIGYVTDSVTGTNWEGRGVEPQVACAADDAVETALKHLPLMAV
jgi:hypothetical protein